MEIQEEGSPRESVGGTESVEKYTRFMILLTVAYVQFKRLAFRSYRSNETCPGFLSLYNTFPSSLSRDVSYDAASSDHRSRILSLLWNNDCRLRACGIIVVLQ